ncbi:MAG: hypothetical protein ACTJHC_02455 [Vagococcus sp.]
MDSQEFVQRIDSLVIGEIAELVVEKDQFFSFREAWLTHPDKESIEGEAGLGGRVVYRKV